MFFSSPFADEPTWLSLGFLPREMPPQQPPMLPPPLPSFPSSPFCWIYCRVVFHASSLQQQSLALACLHPDSVVGEKSSDRARAVHRCTLLVVDDHLFDLVCSGGWVNIYLFSNPATQGQRKRSAPLLHTRFASCGTNPLKYSASIPPPLPRCWSPPPCCYCRCRRQKTSAAALQDPRRHCSCRSWYRPRDDGEGPKKTSRCLFSACRDDAFLSPVLSSFSGGCHRRSWCRRRCLPPNRPSRPSSTRLRRPLMGERGRGKPRLHGFGRFPLFLVFGRRDATG